MDANKIRIGNKIMLDGQPFVVMTSSLRQQPRLATKIITKLKNLLTGSIVEKIYTSGDSVEEADITTATVKYLYFDGTHYVFMDNKTFEQFEFTAVQIGDITDLLIENTDVYVMRFRDKPISIDLPPTLTLKVVETEPGVRGDTATGGSKPAKLETGLTVQVPLFINIDDSIIVNTETKEYRERAK